MTEKQRLYLEAAGDPEVDTFDCEGWMLVRHRPAMEEVAVVAALERYTGELVKNADEWVWVDTNGREHFGPGELGYDRFELNF